MPETMRNVVLEIERELRRPRAELCRDYARMVVDMVLQSYNNPAISVAILSSDEDLRVGHIALEISRSDSKDRIDALLKLIDDGSEADSSSH